MSYLIRPFEKFEDFEQAEQLQNVTWSAVETVPSNMLIAMTHHGAIALGAFDEANRNRMVGFAFSFVSPTHIEGAQLGLSHHSHMAAVLPELRGKGIGLQLKHAQAKAVLAAGYNLMTWTYDPLEAKNANLNITKLGCICRTYIPNCYGEMRDGLNAGLPSDRFEVEWWLEGQSDEWRMPNDERRKIEIPLDFQAMKKADMAAAKAIRLSTREQFEAAFADGFVVTGFETTPERGTYVLTKLSKS
jgi:predicted GNAT superfamily acetyltransferase